MRVKRVSLFSVRCDVTHERELQQVYKLWLPIGRSRIGIHFSNCASVPQRRNIVSPNERARCYEERGFRLANVENEERNIDAKVERPNRVTRKQRRASVSHALFFLKLVTVRLRPQLSSSRTTTPVFPTLILARGGSRVLE